MSFWSWIWPINHLNTLTPSSLVLIRSTLEQSPKLCTNHGKHSPMDLKSSRTFFSKTWLFWSTLTPNFLGQRVIMWGNHSHLRSLQMSMSAGSRLSRPGHAREIRTGLGFLRARLRKDHTWSDSEKVNRIHNGCVVSSPAPSLSAVDARSVLSD